MNGKKARLLRNLTGHVSGSVVNYKVKKGTERKRPIYKTETLEDGLSVRRLVGTFMTHTFVVDAGSRLVYKAMKKMYKAGGLGRSK